MPIVIEQNKMKVEIAPGKISYVSGIAKQS